MELEQPNVIVVATTPKTTVQVTKGFDLPLKDQKFSSTSRSQSPGSGRVTPINPPQNSENAEENRSIGKSRDIKIDPAQLYKKEREDSKEHLYMVVIGHVDAGKSTLMGRMLCELGQVLQCHLIKSHFDIIIIEKVFFCGG